MLNRNLIIFLFFFAKFHSFEGCSSNKNKVSQPCKEYDLSKPAVLRLGDALMEISGISFYPKDSSVFAISDGNGNLYKIRLGQNVSTMKWTFDKPRDFEEVVLHDSTFFILTSTGNIDAINFSSRGDTIFRRKIKFPKADKKKNEFESLYYDDQRNGLVMICKNCDADKKNTVSAWNFNPENDTYTSADFSIDADNIAKRIGEKKIKLKPSGAAINPLTGDVWILASANQLLVVTNGKGNVKEAYTLDPLIFAQPEGITFTPWGDLLISNEAADKYRTPTLLIFKPRKKI